MAPPLSITVSRRGPAMRLSLEGEVDMASAPKLLSAIQVALHCDIEAIEVDLTEVWFLDSSGIRALVQAQRAVDQHRSFHDSKIQLLVLHPSRIARVALLASGVDGYLTILNPVLGPTAPN